MKKNPLLVIVLTLLVILISCERETFTVQDAAETSELLNEMDLNYEKVRDSLNKVGGVVSYSVFVVPQGDKTTLKSTEGNFGTDTVLVTVSQWGKVVTKAADNSGIAVFDDMRIGSVSVSVNAPNHTSVDFVAEIIPERDSTVLKYYNLLRYAATMVPVFSTVNNLASIKGKVTYESDLTNKTPENAQGVEVIGLIDAENASFRNLYLPYFGNPDYDIYSNPSFYEYYTGKIRQITYSSTSFRTTTDAEGNYTLPVPSTNNGLPIKLTISELVQDQKILLNVLNNQQVNSVQSIRTFFNSGIGSAVTPSLIPWVPGAYVTFSAPTGDVNMQPKTPATANAIIGESGIASITVSNEGVGYTQAPILVISKGTGYNPIAAEATAVMSNGKILGVNITNPGQGYTAVDVPTVWLKDVTLPAANPTPVFSYGVIDFSAPTNTGHGFESVPELVVSTIKGNGSGATAEPLMSGYVDINSVEVNTGGSEYTVVPDVIFTAPSAGFGFASPVTAAGTAVMTTNNPVHSIVALNSLTNAANSDPYWYETSPEVSITTTGNGSGATAIADLKDVGRVERILVTNAGTGYDNANPPAVTITGGGGFGASAYATVSVGGQVTVVLSENGQGYTSDPIVTIDAPASAGTQAVGVAIRSFQVEKITLTNGGSGYTTLVDGNSNIAINLSTLSQSHNLTLNTHIKAYPSMQLSSITITNVGSGYTTIPDITIAPKNQFGSGATATTSLLYNLYDVRVVNEGSGYTDPTDIKIEIVADAGTYLLMPVGITASLGKGVLTDIQLPYGQGGEGYTASPLVEISSLAGFPPDRFARVTANISGGTVSGFTIEDAGANYDYGTYTATIKTNITAGFLTANVNKYSGQIIGANITNPGEGYVVAPYIEFMYNGSAANPYGTTAIATTTLTDGRVTAINIINPGSGYYTAPSINFVIPSNAVIAKGYAIFDANGAISSISLFNSAGTTSATGPSGFGYITAPEVTITPTIEGVGRDAKAIAKISNGSVVLVEMVNKGSGYISKNNIPGMALNNQTPTYNPANDYITYPTYAGKGFEIKPFAASVDAEGNHNGITVTAGKTYIRDLYLGTGRRSTDGSDY